MLKKLCGGVSFLLFVVLLALAALLFLPKLLGYQEMAVLSGSMEPKFPVGSIVYVKELPFEKLKTEDVITYRISGDTYVTHRITEILNEERSVRTKGDANDNVDSSPVAETQIVGKAYFSVPLIGYISIYAKTPRGIGIICGLLIAVILLNFLPEIFTKEEPES